MGFYSRVWFDPQWFHTHTDIGLTLVKGALHINKYLYENNRMQRSLNGVKLWVGMDDTKL